MEQIKLEQFCDEWLKSWSGNRPETLVSFYHDEAFYLDPAFPQGIKGKENLLNYFTKLLRKFPDWKWERELLFPTSEGFTLIWKATIQVKEKTVSVKGMDRVALTDMKISRNEVYFDSKVLS